VRGDELESELDLKWKDDVMGGWKREKVKEKRLGLKVWGKEWDWQKLWESCLERKWGRMWQENLLEEK